jgi:hypothetical protein
MLSEHIQSKIRSFQRRNESNCEKDDKIFCEFSGSGATAQIQCLMTCLLRGFYTKNLVVIGDIFRNYLNSSNISWDQFISPLSETCQSNHLSIYLKKESDSYVYCDRKYIFKTI